MFIVEGGPYAPSGTYDCTIYCSSDAPTKSPSTEPTTEPTSGPTIEPTTDPSTEPTTEPTTDPTEDPTAEPTVDPTENPTSDPTADPTADPTVDPTSAPTVSPSDSPTESPTAAPTSEPTDSPTTPSPTHPGEKICGDEFNGTYHGEPMNVEVRMPYDGDLTMDCSGSNFEIGSITAYDSRGNELTDADAAESVLTVHDLGHGGDYTFIVEGGPYAPSGTYDCTIECSSDAPTKSPSTEPTTEPTSGPTIEPTPSPTMEPTVSPTAEPTLEPTPSPTPSPTLEPTTSSPTASPTTPAPTHPGELICGEQFDGSYSGETVDVEVRMPHDGDMMVDCSASDFEISSITAYDASGNVLTSSDVDSSHSASKLTVLDLTHGGDYSFSIQGAAYITSGTFNCTIECTSDAPSNSPTKMPTLWPTVSPTAEPTESPIEDPTTDSPTTSPTADPTIPPGCCAGDSERTTTRCNVLDSETSCTRRASCHWIQTFDNTDCAWSYVEEPSDPGCCVAVDGSYEESMNCINFYEEEYCPTDYCYWTPTSDSFDCSKLWTPPPGCCKSSGSSSSRKNARCEMLTSEDLCEARSACEWME